MYWLDSDVEPPSMSYFVWRYDIQINETSDMVVQISIPNLQFFLQWYYVYNLHSWILNVHLHIFFNMVSATFIVSLLKYKVGDSSSSK